MAYYARQAAPVDGAEAAFDALTDPRDPRQAWAFPALVEGPGPYATGAGVVHWVRRDDDAWEMDTEGGAGTLVLSLLHYPGLWRAEIDGRPTPLLAANAAFNALELPGGRHRVALRLTEPWADRLHALFAAALLLALALLTWSWRGRARKG
jgi:hypothetical protein